MRSSFLILKLSIILHHINLFVVLLFESASYSIFDKIDGFVGNFEVWKDFFVICVPHYFLLFCGTLYVRLLQIVSIQFEYLSRPIDKVIGIHKNMYLDKQWPVILKSFINHTTKLIECNIPWLSILKEGVDFSCCRFFEGDLSCHAVSFKT